MQNELTLFLSLIQLQAGFFFSGQSTSYALSAYQHPPTFHSLHMHLRGEHRPSHQKGTTQEGAAQLLLRRWGSFKF